ncbi:zinc finger MYM-type protein 3-like isoform X3 [Coregonus clupeaformis]|uniref:zinc finger MYM-type protein 3-like isoform X3 n=1 Tax=Coregonus clupeaformis TaxID=59861 RepID=UPI001E1C3752|nr:zinc finger MYM-type protein 3-like isoform X3 [Coregonus clupeaformis]
MQHFSYSNISYFQVQSMEPSEHPETSGSFQMANENVQLDLLSTQTDMDLFSGHTDMGLLPAQTDVDLLTAQSDMDLQPTQTDMEVTYSGSLGTERQSGQQQALDELTTFLTQSERERQKTQDSLNILGDPDSLELSKAQVEEFYSRTVLPEPSDLQESSDLPEPSDLPESSYLPEPSGFSESSVYPEPSYLPEPSGLPEPSDFQEPSGPATGLSQDEWGGQGHTEAWPEMAAEPGTNRLEVTEGTQTVTGTTMTETGEEQMDIVHEDPSAPSQDDVDPNMPSIVSVEGSHSEDGPGKEEALSFFGLVPKVEDTDTGTAEKKNEREQPVGGSMSPLSSWAQPLTPGEAEEQPETEVAIEDAKVSQSGQNTTGRKRGRPRRGEVRKNTQSMSDGDQLTDSDSDDTADDPRDTDFDPARSGLRRSTRASQRSHNTLSPRLIAPKPSGPASTPGYTQRSGGPPPPRPPPPRQPTRVLCANCSGMLQSGQTAYQRRGQPQLFCSSTCLNSFGKKAPKKKPCAFCKRDMGNSKDTMLAQVGQSQSFQEFCNNTCLSLYEARLEKGPKQPPKPSAPGQRCSVCNHMREINHEVTMGNMIHLMCSDACFNRFRATKGLKTSCCDACGTYINTFTSRPEYLLHEGQQRRFCNSSCLRLYKMKNTKVLSCQWCRTLCKNFDMLSKVDQYGKTKHFCSLCCIASHKVKTSVDTVPSEACSFCKRSPSEPYYCKANETVYVFCSPSCWSKFQRNSPNGGIYFSCLSCHNMFSGKPEILDWQDSIYQFCCKECCEDYKRLNGVVSVCEHCKQEKPLHEKMKFSGVEKSFCSDGCILLYKQDFAKQLGLCCITCTYCSQTCSRAVTEEQDGNTWDFCSEDCKSKYFLWYLKEAKCHACKRQGQLLETIHWRGEIKHYCDQPCLLRFYSQQNQPNLDTKQGPESLLNSASCKSPESTTPPAATKTSEATGRGLTKTVAKLAPPVTTTISQRNKSSMCKPMMTTTGVTCKPEMKSQSCQTDDFLQSPPAVLPVPVPVFVPVPLNMYCQYTPITMALPLPLPVPMFLPVTLDHIDKLVEYIKELKLQIPSDPLEADILAMADMIAEENKGKGSSDLSDLDSDQKAGPLLRDYSLFESSSQDDILSMAVNMDDVLTEPGQDPGDELTKASLDLNPNVDFLFDCGMPPHATSPEQSSNVAVQKGPKRQAMPEMTLHDPLDSQPLGAGLNSSIGVDAWRSWSQSKHSDADDRKQKPLDLLLCSPEELNHGLSQFVQDIVHPRGPCYKPDSVFYLCLGIQQYLLENNRMVNIFTDQLYVTFAQELNKIVSKWLPSMSANGDLVSRVLEEHLWECKQLGVYSPFVLLNTLMFFNTKYFGLTTVEQHLQLSFSTVTRQAKRRSTPHGMVKSSSVCYRPKSHHKRTSKEVGLGKRKRDESSELEQQENRMNPLRCPVKFFEFYLSKCSDGVRSSCSAFYLQPEGTCMAESSRWYSDVPMDKGRLGIMLNRILAVKDVYEEHPAQGDMD